MQDHAVVLRRIDLALGVLAATACIVAVRVVEPSWSWWGLAAVAGTAIVFACPVAIVVGRREHRMLLESPVLVPAVLLLPPATAIVATVLGMAVGTAVRIRWERSGDAASRTLRTVAIFGPSVVLLSVVATHLGHLHWLALVLLLEAVHLAVVVPVPLLRSRANRTVRQHSWWQQLRLSLLVAPLAALCAGSVVVLVEVAGPEGLVAYAPVVLLLAWGRRLTDAQQDRRRLDGLYGLVLATGDVERPEAAHEAAVVAAQQVLPGAEVHLVDEPPPAGRTGVPLAADRWLVATRPTDGFTPDDRDALAAVGRLAANAAARAALQHELERQDRVKTALLAAAGHDLRTPLLVQSALAARLVEGGHRLDATERAHLAGRIAANAERLERLVDALVDLERLELAADADEEVQEPGCDPVDVVRDWVEVAELDPSYRVQVVTEGGRTARVVLPATHLERILENLLVNALRHCPVGEPVTVRVRPQGDEVLVAVEDRGPGVPPDERERIFEALHQGTGRGAAGLGLFIVARLVEHVGGRVDVTDRDGGGASFQVWLPTASGLVWTAAVDEGNET